MMVRVLLKKHGRGSRPTFSALLKKGRYGRGSHLTFRALLKKEVRSEFTPDLPCLAEKVEARSEFTPDLSQCLVFLFANSACPQHCFQPSSARPCVFRRCDEVFELSCSDANDDAAAAASPLQGL